MSHLSHLRFLPSHVRDPVYQVFGISSDQRPVADQTVANQTGTGANGNADRTGNTH